MVNAQPRHNHTEIPAEFAWTIESKDFENFLFQTRNEITSESLREDNQLHSKRCCSTFECGGPTTYIRVLFSPEISEWCEQNFTGKYLISYRRRWWFGDYCLIAFNRELDWLYFKMRW
jgi:hypothetical protein